jgi:hypothetical protein
MATDKVINEAPEQFTSIIILIEKEGGKLHQLYYFTQLGHVL